MKKLYANAPACANLDPKTPDFCLPLAAQKPASDPGICTQLGKNRETPPPPPPKAIGNRGLIRVAAASRLVAGHWKTTGENLKGSSVLGCGRWKNYGSDPNLAEIEVIEGVPRMLGHFKCGAVWSCEACSKLRVAQTRSWIRCALVPAVESRGLSGSLATFTLSHEYSEDWGQVVARLQDAFKLTDRRLSKAYAKIGYVGRLKSLEAPIGRNGIHPHFHCLIIHDKGADLVEFAATVKAAWEKSVAEVGGNVNHHGFDLQPDRLDDYAAKMEIAHELASYSTKAGRQKGASLGQLLDRFARGDLESGANWVRAQKALGGRSRFHAGLLPKKLGIVCPSLWEDEELNAVRDARKAHQEEAIVITYPQSRHLKATGTQTNRPGLAMILRAARSGKFETVRAVVDALCAEAEQSCSAQTFTADYLGAVFDAAKLRPLSPTEVMAYLELKRSHAIV